MSELAAVRIHVDLGADAFRAKLEDASGIHEISSLSLRLTKEDNNAYRDWLAMLQVLLTRAILRANPGKKVDRINVDRKSSTN